MKESIVLLSANLDGLQLKDNTASTGYQPVGFGELIVLILIFILVVAACYFVTKFVGNRQQRQLKNSNFQVIDTYRISQTKFLQLVKMGDQFIVLAVTKDQISVVANLSKEEVRIETTANDQQASFHTLISDLLNKKKNDGKG